MERLLCGVDIGGTKLSAALFRSNGTMVAKETTKEHVGKEPGEVLRVIAGLVRGLLDSESLGLGDIEGVGVGITGHVLGREGLIITTSNFKIPFLRYPFVEKLGALLPGTRVLLDNDANVQALGESMYGAGRGYGSMVFITVSTGVGAGIVLGGKLLRGHNGTAGEIGHTVIDMRSTHKCTCGNYGCAMALSSGLFLPELYAEKLRAGMSSRIDIDEKDVGSMCGELLAQGVSCGDLISIEIMNDSADVIGTLAFNVFQFLDPDLVVLGGGLLNLGDAYVKRIRSRFLDLSKDMMLEEMEIKTSELGADSGLLGAASLLRE